MNGCVVSHEISMYSLVGFGVLSARVVLEYHSLSSSSSLFRLYWIGMIRAECKRHQLTTTMRISAVSCSTCSVPRARGVVPDPNRVGSSEHTHIRFFAGYVGFLRAGSCSTWTSVVHTHKSLACTPPCTRRLLSLLFSSSSLVNM